MSLSKEEKQNKWHEEPKNWKWGFLYFNHEDPRLFPPKREKAAGWTINFASPISILIHVIMLSAMLGITQLL